MDRPHEIRSRLERASGRASGPGPGARRWLAVALIVVLSSIAWGGLAIPSAVGPSYDDREAVVGNPVVEGTLPASAAFDRDYWHHIEDAGHYRPLATLLLRWDHARASGPGGEIEWRVFRRTNALLHALIVALLGAALLRFDRDRGLPLPWFGLGLFAVHPVGADVVAWISGRTSLVSAFGAAVGVLLASFVTRARAPALTLGTAFASGIVGTGIALLGKEDGVVLVVALPLACAWRGGRRAAAASFVGAAVAVGAVAAMRARALGSAMPSSPSAPLAETPLVERVTIGLAAWWEGLVAIVAPWVARPPSFDVVDVTSAPGAGVRASLTIAAFVVVAAALAWRTRAGDAGDRERSITGAGLAGLVLVAACVAPLAQIVPAGEVFAPRFLYQPLMLGVFLTSAVANVVLRPLGGTRAAAIQVALLLVCSSMVPNAASVYVSRASYWRAHLPHHEDDGRVWNALGNAAREEGATSDARESFLRAAELDPDYSRPRTNLGTLAIESGDLGEAERWLREAVEVGARNPVAHANLGNVLMRLGRPVEAVAPYREAVRLAPGRGALQRGLGRALLRSGDRTGARAAVRAALALDPGDALAKGLLAEIEAGAGDEPSR